MQDFAFTYIVLMKFPMRRVGKTCVNCYESSSTEFETNKCEYYIDNIILIALGTGLDGDDGLRTHKMKLNNDEMSE